MPIKLFRTARQKRRYKANS